MNVPVTDPFHVGRDRDLPTLALALDPVVVRAQFRRRLPRLAGEEGSVSLQAIRVRRHKPARRCVVEYDVQVQRPFAPPEPVTLIGKVRARRYGNADYRLLEQVWNAGFQSTSPDGISVPEPIGVVPQFRMSLQRKVAGTEATVLLLGPDGVAFARRIAEAIYKLHQTGVPAQRSHLMPDELRILHERLPSVGQAKPKLAKRIERILEACDRLGAALPTPRICGIHRDFYPAQVISHNGRLVLVDFDLYCLGDPALDVGNFLGHVTEISLREQGDAQALADREQAIEERFVELAGPSTRPAIRAYATLTLVRHIYLSTLFAERVSFTELLLELCEQRLGEYLRGPRRAVETGK